MTDLQAIQSIRSDYLAALLADAVNPKPDYSIDGQTVSRAQWRDSLLRSIETLNKLELMFAPYELRGFTL